jgi:hypothetical protein
VVDQWRCGGEQFHEVDLDVRFDHELANLELWVKKLPCAGVLVIPS